MCSALRRPRANHGHSHPFRLVVIAVPLTLTRPFASAPTRPMPSVRESELRALWRQYKKEAATPSSAAPHDEDGLAAADLPAPYNPADRKSVVSGKSV